MMIFICEIIYTFERVIYSDKAMESIKCVGVYF